MSRRGDGAVPGAAARSDVVAASGAAAPRSTPFDRWVASLRHREALVHVRAGSRLCDVGCGVDALFLDRIPGHAGVRAGLDYQAIVARPRGALLVQGDVTRTLPFRDGSFDHVTLLAVIEHLRAPELVLSEAHRILAPGGSVILTWPAAAVDAILAVLRRVGVVSPEMEADQHQPRRPPSEWSRLLKEIGFASVHHHTFELRLNHLMVATRPPA